MKIEDNILILDIDMDDEMMDEFLKLADNKDIESIVIESDNISSLIMQQLFCLKQTKKIVSNDPFLAKFFDDVSCQVA